MTFFWKQFFFSLGSTNGKKRFQLVLHKKTFFWYIFPYVPRMENKTMSLSYTQICFFCWIIFDLLIFENTHTKNIMKLFFSVEKYFFKSIPHKK